MIYNENNYLKDIQERTSRLSKYLNKWFKIENIDRMAIKNRLTRLHIDRIKLIWKVLEETYPGLGDIQFVLEPIYKTHTNTYGSNHVKTFKFFDKFSIEAIYIIVRFPEVQITNSKKQSITIKELFVSFEMRKISNFTKAESVYGLRTTVSALEYVSKYAHSHLMSKDYTKKDQRTIFTKFCTGEGDINSARALFNQNFDPDMLKLYLLQFDTYVRWESIGGVPYFRMDNLIEKDIDYPKVGIPLCRNAFINIRETVRQGKYKLNLNWKLVNGRYYIIDDEKLEDMFRELLLNSITFNRHFIYKDENGGYFAEAETEQTETGVQSEWIPFRGEKVYFTIEGELKKSGPQAKKYINPKIKKYVKSRLEFQANLTKITSLGISYSNSNSYT